MAFLAGRYCMYCCYAKPKPKLKGKDSKDGKTLTHTPSKKALRDPNAARAEAYAKVLRDPKTSRRKEAAKNDVEYAAETAAVPAAVRAAVANPLHREHEERERRAKKEATALKLLLALPEPAPLPEARPEQSLPTFRAVTNFRAAVAPPESRAKKEATVSELLPAPALAPLPEPASLPEAIPELFLPTFRAMANLSNYFSQVTTARFSPTEPANKTVVAAAAMPEESVTDDPPDLNA